MEIVSVFTVTEYKTAKEYTEWVPGYGQEAIKEIRKDYPRFTKFVLEGFEIGGNFKYLEVYR